MTQYFKHFFLTILAIYADSPKSANGKKNVGYSGDIKNGKGKKEVIYTP